MSSRTTHSIQEEERHQWRVGLIVILALTLAATLYFWLWQLARPSVASTFPADGASEVPLTTHLRIEFWEPMDTGSLPDVQATPALSATHNWQDEYTLLFRPHLPLQPETAYQIAVTGNLWTAEEERVTGPITWEFQTGAPQIAYLHLSDAGQTRLFTISPSGNSPTALTAAELNVIDFEVATQGKEIAYVVQRADGGSDIRIINEDGSSDRQVLACAEHLCTNPVWEPGDRRLVYERRELSPTGAPPGPSRLWWLDPGSGETVPVFADEQLLSSGAQFSVDGNWLSYLVPAEEVTLVYNLQSGETLSVFNSIGESAAWHPFQNRFLTTDIEYQGEHFSVHIYSVDAATRERTRLSEQEETNDAAPAWSPNGEWIAFTSKVPRVPIGRQLYLMRADGSGTQRLTADAETNFGPPRWSLDGTHLLFQRYNMAEPDAQPSIWLLEIETGQFQKIADAAYQPAWLP